MDDRIDLLDRAIDAAICELDHHHKRIAASASVEEIIEVEVRDARRMRTVVADVVEGWYLLRNCRTEATPGELPYVDAEICALEFEVQQHAHTGQLVDSFEAASRQEQIFREGTTRILDDLHQGVVTMRRQAEQVGLTRRLCPRPPSQREPPVVRTPRT
ncbi:MAG: hypothetical protein HOW73_34540 [Polyangiaceae bacterium]|nr:hypothetical protein [Polyangiaceae bacterium]